MIKTFLFTTLALMAVLALPVQAAEVGKAAPDFTGTDTKGVAHKLSDLKGKTVVLEWTNPECPYVVKHYDSGNMQKLQEKYTADGVVWLTVNSSAAEKQGNLSGADADKYVADHKAKATAYILDTKGEIGKMYDAKTTPHMYVINKEGTLVYAGAIDSNDSFKPETIEGATNYVADALDALAANKPVQVASSKPYGCGVKY